MTTIAKNSFYAILTDASKNRLYLTLSGYWKDRSDVPNYVNDLKRATSGLSRGYTILTDTTRMKTPTKEVVGIHTEAQKVVMSAGLSKTAELVSQDAIAKMATDRFSKESGMQKGSFGNKAEAETWLDQRK